MSKYISPSLNWIVDGTVGELKANIIYSVGFCGTTRRPRVKGTIGLWSCIKSIKWLKQLPPRSNRRSRWVFSWNWYHITHIHLLAIHLLTNIYLTLPLLFTLTLRIWIIINNMSWHQINIWIWNNKPSYMVVAIKSKESKMKNFAYGRYIHKGYVWSNYHIWTSGDIVIQGY